MDFRKGSMDTWSCSRLSSLPSNQKAISCNRMSQRNENYKGYACCNQRRCSGRWLAGTRSKGGWKRPCDAVERGWVLCSAWAWTITLRSQQSRVWCTLAVQRVLGCGELLCPSIADARPNAPNRPWSYSSPHYGNTSEILGTALQSSGASFRTIW